MRCKDAAGKSCYVVAELVPLLVRAVKGFGFQRVKTPPGNLSLLPEAIGAAVEVTKPSGTSKAERLD